MASRSFTPRTTSTGLPSPWAGPGPSLPERSSSSSKCSVVPSSYLTIHASRSWPGYSVESTFSFLSSLPVHTPWPSKYFSTLTFFLSGIIRRTTASTFGSTPSSLLPMEVPMARRSSVALQVVADRRQAGCLRPLMPIHTHADLAPVHCGSSFPAWALAARIVFASSPNSASCERVFALLRNLFGELQMRSLADYVQAALMLNYNQRNVG